jgi:hypothetical protein
MSAQVVETDFDVNGRLVKLNHNGRSDNQFDTVYVVLLNQYGHNLCLVSFDGYGNRIILHHSLQLSQLRTQVLHDIGNKRYWNNSTENIKTLTPEQIILQVGDLVYETLPRHRQENLERLWRGEELHDTPPTSPREIRDIDTVSCIIRF